MTENESKTIGEMMADAAQEAWEIHSARDPRVSALLNMVRGGRMTFEEFAAAMFCTGWVIGFGSGYETALRPESEAGRR